jgi:hypothetical protein
MAEFPKLKTGAVAQHPAQHRTWYANEAMHFVDGSEQRVRQWTAPLNEWIIDLDLLDEEELAAIEEFFRQVRGKHGSFAFTDPFDGMEYADCSLAQDEFGCELRGIHEGRTRLRVRENRS